VEGPTVLNKKVRIDEILWQAREELIKFNTKYQVNITLASSLTDADQMIIVGDDYLLKVAVSNIMDNACKYSPDHTVNVNIQNVESRIDIVFEDHGIGISEKDLQKIFEPFYRGNNAQAYAGSGIGLPLVNQIITNYNGTIKLDSEINKGTRITVTFPTN
jgi:signal transduction histidine kinase